MNWFAVVLALVMSVPVLAQPSKVAATYIPKLERNLRENIIPFWLDKSIDKTNGGYIIAHDAAGKPNPSASKGLVTQSRQVWLFSKLAREGYRPKETLAAAAHGFAFLRDRMWDMKHGGFFWEVDAAGTKVIRPKKHMYGQSFALYALAEYYLASSDKRALALAEELFAIFEAKAYDREFGGYRESFEQDWSASPAAETHYMSVPSDLKLMNTHLHLLESVTTYYRATKSPVARARLLDLVGIETNAVVRKEIGACTDKYSRDWTPRLEGNFGRASYGHDLENVWLVADALNALELPVGPYVDLFRALWRYSLKYGYDFANGGFYYTGPLNAPSDDRRKDWWVQAEVLVSALYMYQYTRETQYLEVFTKTYDLVENYMTDWEVGEWHASVDANSRPSGAKAHIWKAGYHNGRAMIECLRLLRALR